ncbi:retrovirus-related pol polyprotein from transposon TNT 1-94 [Tanacetum coccineum]
MNSSMKSSPSLKMNSVNQEPQILCDSSIPNTKDVVLVLDEASHPESANVSESTEPPIPQDRWSREKHIELVYIIGKPLAGITTRSRIRDLEAASAHECLYVNFILEIEPKKLIEAIEEEGWVLAMTEELNQSKRNKVWNLVPKPYEGIDYDEAFAPVARLEAIRILLAYESYMGFIVYQLDMKSAFLNGKSLEEVYVEQPPGLLKKFEIKLTVALGNPLHASPKQLGPAKSRNSVKYQANPKESHLVVMKRIFRYLKGTLNLGLFYPKGSGFDLKAFSDSDYARCNLDRKTKAEYVVAAGCYAQVL